VVLDDNIASGALVVLCLGIFILVIMGVSSLTGRTVYNPTTYLVVFLLTMLPSLGLMFLRIRGFSLLLRDGVETKAKVVRREVMLGTLYNPPMLSVTLSYRVLDTTYQARLWEGAPTNLGSLKEGDEVTLLVDPGRPSRYVFWKDQVLKHGRAKVAQPSTWEYVKARVVRCERPRHRKSGPYEVDITFNFRGQEYRETRIVFRQVGMPPPYKPGDEVMVIVEPSAPQHFYLPDNPS